jgi:hypothetical protein
MKAGVLAFLMLFVAALTYAETKFDLDAYFRARYENMTNLNHDALGYNQQSYVRFKTSLGARFSAGDNFSSYLKLTNENRTYIYRSTGNAEYNIDEVVIDNLFAEYKNISSPLGAVDVKAGRMEFGASEYGEGFLIVDGTPEDGSRTYYFNAAKVTLKNDSSSLDVIGLSNTETDYMPVINRRDPEKTLNYGRENAIIAYAKTKPNDVLYLEPYYIYKTEEVTNKRLPDKTELSTVGAYLKFDYTDVAVRVQAAGQFGTYGDDGAARNAFGGYGFVDIKDKLIFDKITLGGVYLSGDKDDDKTVTGWDPLFSRYPWFSNLVCYTFVDEGGVAYWSNLQMYTASVNIGILENLGAFLSYNILYANENAAGKYFADGKHRGNLAQCRFNWCISKSVNTVFEIEHMQRGDFYLDKSDAIYARVEAVVKI